MDLLSNRTKSIENKLTEANKLKISALSLLELTKEKEKQIYRNIDEMNLEMNDKIKSLIKISNENLDLYKDNKQKLLEYKINNYEKKYIIALQEQAFAIANDSIIKMAKNKNISDILISFSIDRLNKIAK
jgi:F0F1-type ATP synthase membrane subunit b/b'